MKTHNMKRHFIFTSLMLIGLFGAASVNLAAEDTWTKKADMPTARLGLAVGVVNGKIYAIGGADNTLTALSAVEMYDPATDTWTKKTDMPRRRLGVSSCAVNGKIYAIGGTTAWGPASVSWVEEYYTGFVPEPTTSVNPAGKLPTLWGEIKQDR